MPPFGMKFQLRTGDLIVSWHDGPAWFDSLIRRMRADLGPRRVTLNLQATFSKASFHVSLSVGRGANSQKLAANSRESTL